MNPAIPIEIVYLIAALVGMGQINRHKEWLARLCKAVSAWYYNLPEWPRTALFVVTALILIAVLMRIY